MKWTSAAIGAGRRGSAAAAGPGWGWATVSAVIMVLKRVGDRYVERAPLPLILL